MSREVAIIFRDDVNKAVSSLDGDTITEVTLGYCGKVWELDLGPDNKARLEEILKPWLTAGRLVEEHHEPRLVAGDRPMSKVVLGRRMREFAGAEGIEVRKYGNSYAYSLELRERFSLATGIPLSMLDIGPKPKER
jgi:Lsr2